MPSRLSEKKLSAFKDVCLNEFEGCCFIVGLFVCMSYRFNQVKYFSKT